MCASMMSAGSSFLVPPVTAIAQLTGELGAAAARMLPRMVEEEKESGSVILETVVLSSYGIS